MRKKTSTTAADGRTDDGRFAAGNRGGPGNPFTRRVAALRRAAIQGTSERDVEDVLAALKCRAQTGDVTAARLWLAYTIGQPAASADPDTLDAHELQVRRQGASTAEDLKALFETLPASVVCELAWVITSPVREQLTHTPADADTKPSPVPRADLARLLEACPGLLNLGQPFADLLRSMRGLPGPTEGEAEEKVDSPGRAEGAPPEAR
jgi:hypothetical protein